MDATINPFYIGGIFMLLIAAVAIKPERYAKAIAILGAVLLGLSSLLMVLEWRA